MFNSFSLFLQMFSSQLVGYTALRNLSNLKVNVLRFALHIFIASVISYIVYCVAPNEVVIGITSCLCMMLSLRVESRDFTQGLFYSLFSNLLILAISSLIGSFFINAADVTQQNIRQNDFIYTVAYLLTLSLSYISSFLIAKGFRQIIASYFENITSLASKRMLTLLSVLSFLLTVFIFYNTHTAVDTATVERMMLLNSILIVVIFFFLITVFYTFHNVLLNNTKLRHAQELNDCLQAYNIERENLYSEIKMFRHDHYNLLITAQALIANNDLQGLADFINNDVAPVVEKLTINNQLFLQFEKLQMKTVKGFLLTKVLSAINAGVTVRVEIEPGINNIYMTPLDFIRLLGIFIDNAAEECSRQPGMAMDIIMFETREVLTVAVINDLHGSPPDIAKIFAKGSTTKGSVRGLGLYNAQRIIDKYKNVRLDTDVTDNRFRQKLTFSNEKE